MQTVLKSRRSLLLSLCEHIRLFAFLVKCCFKRWLWVYFRIWDIFIDSKHWAVLIINTQQKVVFNFRTEYSKQTQDIGDCGHYRIFEYEWGK